MHSSGVNSSRCQICSQQLQSSSINSTHLYWHTAKLSTEYPPTCSSVMMAVQLGEVVTSSAVTYIAFADTVTQTWSFSTRHYKVSPCSWNMAADEGPEASKCGLMITSSSETGRLQTLCGECQWSLPRCISTVMWLMTRGVAWTWETFEHCRCYHEGL